MKNFSLIILLTAVILSFSSVFVVFEGQQAIVLQFSKVKKDADDKAVVYGPGLQFKVPFISEVRKLDARIQTLDGSPDRFVTSEKKDLIVDSFVKWRINDFSAFYLRTRGDLQYAETLLKQKVNNGVNPEKFNEIKNDAQSILIDLREQNEIDKDGMIKNSTVVRFPEINEYLQQNKNTLKDKRILFYCAHGHRSTLAVQLSKSYQFTNCVHLIGGLKNWKKEGLEL